MSTRSIIGKQNPDDTVSFIYCHFDGYPSGVGQTLVENYKTETYVDELLKLGDLSILDKYLGEVQDFTNPRPEWCLAYGRDRGESNTEYQTVPYDAFFESSIRGEDYKYLFSNNEWKCYTYKGAPVQL